MPAKRPFRSKAQARFLFSRKPKTARKMVNEAKRAGNPHPIKGLPKKVRRQSSKRKKR